MPSASEARTLGGECVDEKEFARLPPARLTGFIDAGVRLTKPT